MAEESVFRGIIEFFARIGVYDVVLPFILIFTIVFAILEKTKVLGTDTIDGVAYTKKNLNSMVAFVISFLVIASSRLVELVTMVSAHMVILLLGSVFFLLLVGSFYKDDEDVFLENTWRKLFMVIMFIGLILIFLNAAQTADGESWLQFGWEWIIDNWSSTAAASVILILIVIGIMYFVVQPSGEGKTGSGSEE